MSDLIKKYVHYGVRSDWAKSYSEMELSISTFRQTSIKNLVSKYNIEENAARTVKALINRKPPPSHVLDILFERNNYLCCLCKGKKSDAFIYHHIEPYSETQNNEIENLAVLCPNDHDLAHREGIMITQKITKTQIKKAKKSWENEVARYNKKMAQVKRNHLNFNDAEFDYTKYTMTAIGADNVPISIELTNKTSIILKIESQNKEQKYIVYLKFKTDQDQIKWIGFSNSELINNKFPSEHVFKACLYTSYPDRIIENIMSKIYESGLELNGTPIEIIQVRFRITRDTKTVFNYQIKEL